VMANHRGYDFVFTPAGEGWMGVVLRRIIR
jgi:hypothetical protein